MNLALCHGAALGAERLDKAGLAEAPASVEVRPPSTTSPAKRPLNRKTNKRTEETSRIAPPADRKRWQFRLSKAISEKSRAFLPRRRLYPEDVGRRRCQDDGAGSPDTFPWPRAGGRPGDGRWPRSGLERTRDRPRSKHSTLGRWRILDPASSKHRNFHKPLRDNGQPRPRRGDYGGGPQT